MIPTSVEGLAALAAEVERQTAEVAGVVTGLSDQALGWRPSPKRWSVGGHVAHLCLINRPYLAAVEACLRRAKARGLESDGPYRHPRIATWFADEMEPPPRRRMKTFRRLVPGPAVDRRRVLADFDAVQRTLATLIVEARGTDLGRARFSSPFFKLLRVSLGAGFEITLAHNRRHIWLAREVMADPGFPRAGASP